MSEPQKSEPQNGRGALFAGGLAAILASACCLGPLVLIALGFSGAWIGNLTVLEPYRPIFIGAALVALFFAWRRIYRPAQACKPGEVCAIPQVRATYKLIFWIVAALVLVSLGFPYVMPFFLLITGVHHEKTVCRPRPRCRCCPRVGRHPDRHAVRAWHDLRLLPDHCQARAFQG
uniref:Mercuric transport protein MerT n=40 Tax=Gammaproteobacteria TaxID=1236 RepID=A0A0U3J2S2_PRORE|nr:MerT mercuric transport protein [Providencia rettgeri]